MKHADAAVRAQFATLAGSARAPMAIREEAMCALELLKAPRAAELRERLDAAWSRFWRI